MKIEKDIKKLLNKKFQDLEIIGIRFLKKTDEQTWKFRYTFRDGDFLSLSDEYTVKYEGLTLVVTEDPTLKIFISPGVFTRERDSSKSKKTKNVNS